MQNINEVNETTIDLVDAVTLRGMTPTKEELFERQKVDILQNLMSSMVGVATSNGVSEYAANLHPEFDLNLLNTISLELTGLGYTINTTENETENLGKFLTLSVSWGENSVPTGSKEQ